LRPYLPLQSRRLRACIYNYLFYWFHHYLLKSKVTRKETPLLEDQRTEDRQTNKQNNLATLHFSALYQDMIRAKKYCTHSFFFNHISKRKLDRVVTYGERIKEVLKTKSKRVGTCTC
jgi:hypothetical protein